MSAVKKAKSILEYIFQEDKILFFFTLNRLVNESTYSKN